MIRLGNFFFKYRNFLFIFLYLLLFIPSPQLFNQSMFGESYWVLPIVLGLLITVSGQLIRGATIGLAYIIRGGKDGQVYAEELVTQGIFNHCRKTKDYYTHRFLIFNKEFLQKKVLSKELL